jgi:RHS repeat-associated protein
MKFTGQERDLGVIGSNVDDLDYMHARYYRPLVGRFLSMDPISGTPREPGSWNRYSYVSDNPICRIDPDGEQSTTPESFYMIYGVTVRSNDSLSFANATAADSLFFGGLSFRAQIALASSSAPRDPLGGGKGGLSYADFSTQRVMTLWGHGLAAYADGLVPIPSVEPFKWAGVYDPSEPGMTSTKVIGTVVSIAATAGLTAETRAGAQGGNWLTRNVFRWGVDRQGPHGLHFHLGPGKPLMRHHLPKQIRQWFYHLRGKFF